MSLGENGPSNTAEYDQADTVVEIVAPNGLGFGDGGISVEEQIKQGILTPEAPRRVQEYLLENRPNTFRQVEFKDDGCGDGRPWVKVMQMVDDGGDSKIRFYGESRLRAKVFGGGLVTAASMLRAIKGKPENGVTAGRDRAFMAEQFKERSFEHGAHTSDHADGENCGCGAIDNYQTVTKDAIRFEDGIINALQVIYGDEYEANQAAINQVFELYKVLSEDEEFFADASGKKSMEQILESGAVVKELSGGHVEETIVINQVRGTTLDQQRFTEEVKNACVDKPKTIQAFSVDAWRGEDIAQITADIIASEDPSIDKNTAYKLAMADFWVRTLAVAGTLTAGDLPVYLHRAA